MTNATTSSGRGYALVRSMPSFDLFVNLSKSVVCFSGGHSTLKIMLETVQISSLPLPIEHLQTP